MAYKYRRGRSLILAGYYLEIQDECCRNQVIFAVPSISNPLRVHHQITAFQVGYVTDSRYSAVCLYRSGHPGQHRSAPVKIMALAASRGAQFLIFPEWSLPAMAGSTRASGHESRRSTADMFARISP